MMAFFERQNKPMWWKFFERREMSYEELYEDADCLVNCKRTATPAIKTGTRANSPMVLEYQFDTTQEFRDRRFSSACVLGNGFDIVSVDSVDTEKGLVNIKQSAKKATLPNFLSMVAYEYINPDKIAAGLFAVSNELVENNAIPKPISDFLLRKPPHLPAGCLQAINEANGDEKLSLIIKAVEQLDNSFLSIQGPPGTGKTYTASHVILALLAQQRTVNVDQGIFLNHSYRMHKNINTFISEMVYEGRLLNDPNCDKQVIEHAATANDIALKTAGIVTLPVTHAGNKQSSPEEIEVIQRLVQQLLTSKFTDKSGNTRDIGGNDILVVAPFNYQVNELMKVLGFDARVGTVDLFQGQEAPIVIVSMTSSVAADSPRGLDFLLSINRLNVAIFRAQALAVVVYSNGLLDGVLGGIEDMRRVNFFESLLGGGSLE